jgi:hypothetical protein
MAVYPSWLYESDNLLTWTPDIGDLLREFLENTSESCASYLARGAQTPRDLELRSEIYG